MDTHEVFDELAVAAAMDALDPAEAAQFVAHQRHCARCADTVADTQETLAVLATLLIPAPRTPDLAERIQARATDPHVRHDHTQRAAGRHLLPRRPRRGDQKRWRARTVAAAAAAALMLIGGLTGWNVALQQEHDASEHAAARYRDAATALLAPQARHIALTTSGGELAAVLVLSPPTVQLVTASLAVNDRAHIYVLWAQQLPTGTLVPVGTVNVRTSGPTTVPVGRLIDDLADYRGYAISIEPGHRPPARPSTIIARQRASS